MFRQAGRKLPKFTNIFHGGLSKRFFSEKVFNSQSSNLKNKDIFESNFSLESPPEKISVVNNI